MNVRKFSHLAAHIAVATGVYNSTVDYYIRLISEQIAKANVYLLPQDSSAYIPTSDDVSVYGTYDYIVVGAGSAGAVIATRLSENAHHKILLLEAGGQESDFTDIPKMHVYLQGLELNWNYNSTPQTSSCLGMLNQECPYPRGKALGGSSVINALMYVRGNRRDYNNWANQGNPGWSYDEVLPFFKKSENLQVNGDDGFHGKDGYLNVEYHQPYSPQFNAFVEANLELNRKVVDYNGGDQLGVARTQLNSHNGRRIRTAKAFLSHAINRTNLKILTNSFSIKVLITPIARRARGVLFSHNGKLFTAKARREVIICTGAVGSPQLLMLSGIGPRKHLNDLGIPVIQNLAVGENLQDHAVYFALNFVGNYTEPLISLQQGVEDYLNGIGQLTIAGAQGLGFVQTKLAGIPGYPDIEFMFLPSSNLTNFAQSVYHYNDETFRATYAEIDGSRTFIITPVLLHPKSRGSIRLKSKNPFEYPEIDIKFLSDYQDHDIETLYQGVQLALEMIETNAFRKLNATLRYSPLPACLKHKYLSREYWYCQLRHMTIGLYHPVGTCKMGPDSSKGAAVNHELKVHGIKNLRVADASIIPESTSGHTNAPAIMIGEKVADLIKKAVSKLRQK